MNPTSKSPRIGASVNAYLILRQNDTVLLSLRKNTGYFDHLYGLISGHVEDGESASQAIIREALEEANIQILESSLKPVHVMHRKSDRFNVDIFFECNKWEGLMCNQEPNKCEELRFFPLSTLPENVIAYIRSVLACIAANSIYSETGWGEEEKKQV